MQTIVGVLRGGPSREHEVSLKTGAEVMKALPEDRFLVRDLYIDRAGQWYDRGRTTAPADALRQIDVAFVALHGEYGEDGQVQRLLELFGVPYTGSDPFASHLAMHKLMSKMQAQGAGLHTPEFRHLESAQGVEEVVYEIVRTFSQPVVVKPVGWGSSIGVSVVGGYAHILAAIQGVFAAGAPSVLVEEYVRGKEATVGVVEGLRGEDFYTLPPVEIVTPRGACFSLDAKYSGTVQERCPGTFSRVDSEELMRAARLMHRTLGLRHYSRSDFIVTPRGVYYLESNTLPGLTRESLMPKALAAVGHPFSDFVAHLVNLARTR